MEENRMKSCNEFAKEVVELYFGEIDKREEKARQIRLKKEQEEKRKRQKENILMVIWYVIIGIILLVTINKISTIFNL